MRTTDVRRVCESQPAARASVGRVRVGGRAALARPLVVTSLVLLLATLNAHAHAAVPTPQADGGTADYSALLAAARRVRTGATIRVLASDPQLALTGRLAARPDSSSLTLITGSGRRVRRHTVSLVRIDTLWVPKHPYKRNMLIGAVFPGLLFGAALDGLAGMCILCERSRAEVRRERVLAYAGGMVGGAELGYFVARWKPRWVRRFPAPAERQR